MRSLIRGHRRIWIAVLALSAGFALLRGILREPIAASYSSSQAFYDREHRLLRLTLSADQKYRLWIPLKEISPLAVQATLLHEDRHFRGHPGFNPGSLARAFVRTYLKGAEKAGASTITMQLARMRYGIHSRSISGKIRQILAAFQLECLYSKDEILEAYFNLAPYGGNIEGIGAASLIYFHKAARELTLPEAMTLALLPQSPTRRNISLAPRNPALDRARDRLYRKWIEAHGPDERLATEMRLPLRTYRIAELPFRAPHFVDFLLQKDVQGGEVRTPVDTRLQELLERNLRQYVASNRNLGIKNAAALLVDHRSSEIRAMVGSVDYFDPGIAGQVNGTQAKRSPGSALKPFVYALGMDQGLIHPLSMLKDTPTSFGAFDPENFDRDFVGPIAVKDALVRSRNIPAVFVASRLRSPSLYEFLKNVGITRLRSEDYYGLALPLGGAEVTMLELAQLYSALAQGGVLRPLQYLAREKEPVVPVINDELRLLSPDSSFMTLEMLYDNPRPNQHFQSEWTRNTLPIAWKTGTSHGFRDAWTIGIIGPYVLGVWIGNFDGESNPNFVGRDTAAPLFFRIADGIRNTQRDLYPPMIAPGRNLKQVKVCALSGELPGPFCTHHTKTWYIAGKSPIRTCSIHRKVYLNPQTGLRLCPGTGTEHAISKVYEFWPSDLLRLFAKAGLPRKMPPPYDAKCSLQAKSDLGLPPAITSPKDRLTYALRASHLQGERISFSANTDADARELYWFVNDQFIGKTASSKPLFWKPKPGQFLVRVVDDQGRSDSRALQVTVVE